MDDSKSVATAVENVLVEKSQFITAGVLGEGGFGKVFTGMMLKNGNWYAIKEIKKMQLVKHKLGTTMILNELEAMKRLDHPAIINLHYAFNDKYDYYKDIMTQILF
jgi:serine/threonine protein kinase